MWALMLQLVFMLLMTPLLLLNQDARTLRDTRQVTLIPELLLIRHQALQQVCAVSPRQPGSCGHPRPGELFLGTVEAYLPQALWHSPYLQDDTGPVRSMFDGTQALSFIDKDRLGGFRNTQLLGKVQAQWQTISRNRLCAGLYNPGKPLNCSDGTSIPINNATGLLKEGDPVIVDP